MAKQANKTQKKTMPIIMLPDAVAFPSCPHQFDVFGANMIAAIRSARKADRCIFIMLNEKGEPSFDITGRVGIVATITQMLRHPEEESMHVRVMGEYRAWVKSADLSGEFDVVEVVPAEEIRDEDEKDPGSAIHNKLFKELIPALNRAENKPELDTHFVMERRSTDYGSMIDSATYIYPFPLAKKQRILDCLSVGDRVQLLYKAVSVELEQAKLDREIEKKVNESMDNAQREYYLREKIRIISEELGDGGTPESDAEKGASQGGTQACQAAFRFAGGGGCEGIS